MKRLIAFVLAAVMCLSLCACGSEKTEDTACNAAEKFMKFYGEALTDNYRDATGTESTLTLSYVADWKIGEFYGNENLNYILMIFEGGVAMGDFSDNKVYGAYNVKTGNVVHSFMADDAFYNRLSSADWSALSAEDYDILVTSMFLSWAMNDFSDGINDMTSENAEIKVYSDAEVAAVSESLK